jgi:hypothetical protein
MRLTLAGAAHLVSSGYIGAGGVHSAPGAPGPPSSDGRQPCYGVRLTALRMSSLWSANSPDDHDDRDGYDAGDRRHGSLYALCGAACDGREVSGRDPGSWAGWPSLLNAGTRSTRSVYAPGIAGHGQQPNHRVEKFRVFGGK